MWTQSVKNCFSSFASNLVTAVGGGVGLEAGVGEWRTRYYHDAVGLGVGLLFSLAIQSCWQPSFSLGSAYKTHTGAIWLVAYLPSCSLGLAYGKNKTKNKTKTTLAGAILLLAYLLCGKCVDLERVQSARAVGKRSRVL